MDDAGGWLWFLIDVVAVALLGAAIAYGTVAWRKRPKDPATERARDDATRRAYEDK
jgi:hypothetical protein